MNYSKKNIRTIFPIFIFEIGVVVIFLFTGGCFSKRNASPSNVLIDTSFHLAPINIIKAPGITMEIVKVGDIAKIRILKSGLSEELSASEIRKQKRLERIKLREQKRLERLKIREEKATDKLKLQSEIAKAKAKRKLDQINNKKNIEAAKTEAKIEKSKRKFMGIVMPWRVKIVLVIVVLIFIIIGSIMLVRWISQKITT